MKKEFFWIGSLFLVVLMTAQFIYPRVTIQNRSVIEQGWEVSPSFQMGDHAMIGQPSKVGIKETTFQAGEEKGVHWYLWGEQEALVKGTFKLTAMMQGEKEITLIDNSAIAYGNEGADAQVPTLITIPSPGLWKFDAYVDDEWYGSIVLNVSE